MSKNEDNKKNEVSQVTTSESFSSRNNMENNLKRGRKVIFNKKTLIDIGIILVISIFITAVLGFVFTSYVDTTIVAIEKENINEAKKLYNGHIKDDNKKSQEFFFRVDEYLNGVVESYNIDKIDYTEATKIINIVENAISDFDTKAYVARVEGLKSSKSAYEDGYTYSLKGEYVNAIRKYKQVIKEDVKYDDVQNKIEKEKISFKKKMLKEIESAIGNGSEYYATAINNAKELIDNGTFDNDAEFDSAYQNLVDRYIDILESQIELAREEKKHKEMYKIASKGIYILGDNEILNEWMEETRTAILEDALYVADLSIASNDYKLAAESLVEALEYCPNEPQITVKLKMMIADLSAASNQ